MKTALSLSLILFFSAMGSFIWYVQVLISVYGANEFSANFQTTVTSAIIISTLLSIPLLIWRKKQVQK